MPGYAYGGYSMHLPPIANTTKIHHDFVYMVRRQLDDKPLVWWPGMERRHYSNHIEQGGALVY